MFIFVSDRAKKDNNEQSKTICVVINYPSNFQRFKIILQDCMTGVSDVYEDNNRHAAY